MSVSPFFLVAGPCVIESEELLFEVAEKMKSITDSLKIPFYFKASFDKANRTSGKSYRGLGPEEGLQLMARIKDHFKVPVLTDIHEEAHAELAAKYVDVLQIPAFLCRQTDLLVAAAKTGKIINVKKGQFLAPEDVNAIADKLKASGCKEYWMTERGTTFGYHNLVVDMRSLAQMRAAGHPVVFDATHSVQRPGGLGNATGGDRTMAPVLARAAVAVGVNGLFIETHPHPDKALSDGPNMIPLAEMEGLLQKLKSIHEAASSSSTPSA
jgi:2-dehydro-3-deoxyphosphooctonate aldolase (KDO 8-P synthase)